jgi:nucleotide-binding universal stress UspA family protein
MGTQGLGGFRKWLLGSTTERVLRRTHVPVLAVPSGSHETDVAQASRSAFDIVRILAATDFSEASVVAIKYAVQLADRFSAAITLAHVVEPVTVPPPWHSLVEGSDEARLSDGRDRLEALAAQFCGARDCDVVVSPGRPADVIGQIAEDRHAQLIVMALSGAQGSMAPRPGSIAYRVLGSTGVPVLVVPASLQLND